LHIRKVFAVAKWEFLGKVKTRAFIISVVVTPLILISLTIGGTLISSASDSYTKVIGIVDTSGIYFQPLREKISEYTLDKGYPAYLLLNLSDKTHSVRDIIKQADKSVLDNRMTAYIFITHSAGDSVILEIRSNSMIKPVDISRFEKTFTEVKNLLELKRAGINESILRSVSFNTHVVQTILNDKGNRDTSGFIITFFSSVIFIMLLITLVMTTGGMLVRNLVEEKSTRLIDVILSSCSVNELLSGKILGLSSIGFFQVAIWILMGTLFYLQYEIPAQAFENAGLILVYFIFGFFLFTSLFVGIGSLLNTEQEAQQVTSYLSILMVFPIALALPALENPDFLLIKILSYFPLTLPSVMILRLNTSNVPVIEVVLTIAILILSIIVIINISSGIFRIGILSQGKALRLSQVYRRMKDNKQKQ
jgi:ABC-2 type transport system permease protein